FPALFRCPVPGISFAVPQVPLRAACVVAGAAVPAAALPPVTKAALSTAAAIIKAARRLMDPPSPDLRQPTVGVARLGPRPAAKKTACVARTVHDGRLYGIWDRN